MPLSGSCRADRLSAWNVDVLTELMFVFSLRVRGVPARAESVHVDRLFACYDTTIFVTFVGACDTAATNAMII